MPDSFIPTTQTASSHVQCSEGERIITIPTSSKFTVDQTEPFCSKLNFGSTFVSPDGKWTAAIESIPGTDIEGQLYYRLPAGPGLWEADHNLFMVFSNLSTGEHKEFGIARVVLRCKLFTEGQQGCAATLL